MKEIIINRLAVGLLLLGFSQVLFASSYRVEVLVFAHKQPNTEVFEQTTSALKPPDSIVEVGANNDSGEVALDEEPLSGLSAAYQQLSQQANYAVLLKKAWVQSISTDQSTPAAHIQTADHTLNGYVSLITNGAMTMQVDVEYTVTRENRYNQTISITPVIYHLTEKRPLKFNESHYFDHPQIGVIMLVTPL
ncbi:MAG: hypothetical protein HOP02_01590 [Methylococcaceae bacterium]|nr:hypothetical protein [Methylococcaceae bacterium]